MRQEFDTAKKLMYIACPVLGDISDDPIKKTVYTIKDNAEKVVKVIDTVEPEEELVEKYEERYQKFRKIYPAVKELF